MPQNKPKSPPKVSLTVDVEDWFHILDSPSVPNVDRWSSLESRVEANMYRLLELFAATKARCTFFWLGWVAQQHKSLVRECQAAGHEIACHGYAHLLTDKAGRKVFRNDIRRSKDILETITGKPVRGFRSPGFSVTEKTPWAFDEIKEAGYEYDTSIFPAHHGHGGMPKTLLKPYFIETCQGHLLEIPSSVVKILNHRICLFGGGYLRLATKPMIKWGLHRLEDLGQPSVIYVHPREIDPHQPRLPLPLPRRFKCYIRLKSTLSKLEWLCRHYQVCRMVDTIESYIRSFYETAMTLPVVKLTDETGSEPPNPFDREIFVEEPPTQSLRSRILQVENAMATFLTHGRVSNVALEGTGSSVMISTLAPGRRTISQPATTHTETLLVDHQG